MDLVKEPGEALSAGLETPTDRLWAWIGARLRSRGESHWQGRGISLAQGALAGWKAEDSSRPLAGFFDWASDLDRLSSSAAGHEASEADADARAYADLRAYLRSLPGHGRQPMSSIPYEQHGYIAWLVFGETENERRFVERACDEPWLMGALAPMGFKAWEWPESETRALEGLSLMEAAELGRSLGETGRGRETESGRI